MSNNKLFALKKSIIMMDKLILIKTQLEKEKFKYLKINSENNEALFHTSKSYIYG